MSAYYVFLGIHILAGSVALISGFIAARSRKRKGSHTTAGEVYHTAYVAVAVSAIVMAIEHWTASSYLFYIAVASYGMCLYGYVARKRRVGNWLGKHIGGMLGSYIGIVTATLVVNVPHIPVLNQIPPLFFWLWPTAIGTPLIIRIGLKYKRTASK